MRAALSANISRFNEIYDLPGIRSLSDEIMDGKALVRKVVAIAHAAAHLPDDAILLWLDVDTSLDRPLDAKWVKMASDRDLTYIAETDCVRLLYVPLHFTRILLTIGLSPLYISISI